MMPPTVTGQPIDYTLIFVYFIYGMAFFGMGLTLALESEHSPAMAKASILRWLAAFGMIHGTHEWVESYLIQSEMAGLSMPTWMPWVRIVFLFSSFSALVIYGAKTLRENPFKSRVSMIIGVIVLGLYLLGILTSAGMAFGLSNLFNANTLDGLARYLLAVPGSGLAALALQSESIKAKTAGKKGLAGLLTFGAVGFAVYLLTQIFVPKMDMFPASLINAFQFREFAGFPIQIIRTAAAMVITFCLLRATQSTEKYRQQQILLTRNERLEALEQIQKDLTDREKLRRELLRHIVRAQEEERSRISREIHDETSQTLAAFSLDLATLQNTLPKKSEAHPLVERLQILSRQMSSGLYQLVLDLRPAQLDGLGLDYALQYLEENFLAKGLKVHFTVAGKPQRLDPIIETVFFRVAQEALTNVLRHAQVQSAHMSIHYYPERTTLRIADRGIGFDPVQSFTPPRGWGLEGMRERVESVEGTLEVKSRSGHGTTIEVAIPLPVEINETLKKGI